MPVPDTYSRRIGSVREDSYSFSSGRAGSGSNRPSYLSSYTSKYTSSLPPRPPAYERKFSELNTSSSPGSRFLNGTTGASRSASNYGTSAYNRSSVSPARTTTSGLRRSLEGITSSPTTSLTDRLRSLDIGTSDKDTSSTNNTTAGSGYKYLTRNRDPSASSLTSTTSSRYGGFRDRSGSRELISSPLITSPLTLGSRSDMKSELLKSRSGTSPPSGTAPTSLGSSSYGRTSRLSTSNGIGSRYSNNSTGTEVTNSSVVSSESPSATPTTNSVVSSTKNEGDPAVDRDVENNDDPRSSSSTTTTSTVSSSSSAAIECSASPLSNNDEVVISLQTKNMNGNDTVTKDLPTSEKEPQQRRSSGSGAESGVDVPGGKGELRSPTTPGSTDSSSTLIFDQDTNGNPIVLVSNDKDNDLPTETSKVTSSKTQAASYSSQTVTPPPTKTKTKTKASATTLADSNANVLETKKSLKSSAANPATSSVTSSDKPEIGVKKSLLKPNPLGSTKVQTKSKIIIHKFKVDDGSGEGKETESNKKPITSRSVKSASPSSAATRSVAEDKTSPAKEDSNSSLVTTTRRKSGEENRHSNNAADVTTTVSLKASQLKTSSPSKKSASAAAIVTTTTAAQDEKPKKSSTEDAANDNSKESTTTNQNSSLKASSPGLTAGGRGKSVSVERNIVIKRPSPPLAAAVTASEEVNDSSKVSSENRLKLKEQSKSRSPSPSTSVTVTLSPPKRITAASGSTDTTDADSSNKLQESSSKAPTPPPLPKTSVTSASSQRFRREPEDVTSDAMAGPHSSKYAGRQGKSDSSDRSSAERDYRTTATTTTRNTYVNSTSDSSDNDSEEYSRSPPTTGRFRTRDAEKSGLAGLRNIGNTCFMNSVLQCLSNTKPLLEYVNNDSYLNDINSSNSSMKGALIRAFAQMIQELWRETRPVDTSAFKDQVQRFAPRFMGYSQQDAQEFLRYLLEGLHEDVNRVTVKPKPITTDIDDSLSESQKAAESWKRYLRYDDSKIVDIFVGQLKSTLRCTTCGHCSVTFDPFWDLSLPIPARSSLIKLSNCFELFTKEEVLDGDEKPTCAKCQCRRKCTKSLCIQKFPKILVIHLKRFSPTERYRGKLSTTVEYPLKGLDLTAFSANTAQGNTFNLYGISNHSGSTYSGHYIAYCKHPYSGEWHCYNDSRVSPVTTNSVVSSEGYVLFYELAGQSSHL